MSTGYLFENDRILDHKYQLKKIKVIELLILWIDGW